LLSSFFSIIIRYLPEIIILPLNNDAL